MAKNRTFKGQKAQKPAKATRPFEGKIQQLYREHVILVSLTEAKPFVQECYNRGCPVGVGSVYNGGVIIYEK